MFCRLIYRSFTFVELYSSRCLSTMSTSEEKKPSTSSLSEVEEVRVDCFSLLLTFFYRIFTIYILLTNIHLLNNRILAFANGFHQFCSFDSSIIAKTVFFQIIFFHSNSIKPSKT